MDQTVYFSTLDQYKYNPALIIGGEVGDEVISAARGIVTDVSETVETGMTVTVELGGGYEVIYGQLMEVTVSPGEYIEKGQAIGKLAEPSRYYSVEGCNLYFQLLKDGESENPIEYLEE
jgi:murein DD-endopeptidase MepM/ murein hydrolase activator NlpD